MTKDQFSTEYQRLHRGFKADDELTPERLVAAFGRWGWMPHRCLVDAVSRALTDARIPHSDIFDRYLDDAHGAFLERERQRSDQDAKNFLTGPLASGDWANAHMRAIRLLLDGDREAARVVLHEINSPANLSIVAPLDGGDWLRANAKSNGLYPPAFLSSESLERIGWPWPEWPNPIPPLGLGPTTLALPPAAEDEIDVPPPLSG